MARYRKLTPAELDRLSDEELIAYVVAARDAGDEREARGALNRLIWGYYRILLYRAKLKLPGRDAEDIVGDAIVSALSAIFSGASTGEFRSWVHTILDRRIADHYERLKRRPVTEPLVAEMDALPGAGRRIGVDGGQSRVEAQQAADQALAELSPQHRQVILHHINGGLTAKEVAERVAGMSENNVHKIAERYRKRVRELLDGDT